MRCEAEAGAGWSGSSAACCSFTELAYADAEGPPGAMTAAAVEGSEASEVASGELVQPPPMA